MEKVINVQLIEDYIQTNGLSKTAFCRRCKIGKETFQKIKTNQDARFVTLFKIARVMNVQIPQLLLESV